MVVPKSNTGLELKPEALDLFRWTVTCSIGPVQSTSTAGEGMNASIDAHDEEATEGHDISASRFQ